jgi:hypothetical protein
VKQALEGFHRVVRDAPLLLLLVIVVVIVRGLWRAPAVARAFTGFLESATASLCDVCVCGCACLSVSTDATGYYYYIIYYNT